MNISPFNHNNKFFSEEEYRYYVDSSREHMASLNTKIIFYKVNKEKSQIDDLYGEAYKEEIQLNSPIEIPAIVKLEVSENKAYASDKSMLRYEEYGNLTASLLISDLELYNANITYGDYIGYRVSEILVLFFEVSNDQQKFYQNKNTFLGYKSFWKTITCTPINKGEGFFEL
jgi:hypothetical protein